MTSCMALTYEIDHKFSHWAEKEGKYGVSLADFASILGDLSPIENKLNVRRT